MHGYCIIQVVLRLESQWTDRRPSLHVLYYDGYKVCVRVCVCCVCERDRDRETERGRERDRERLFCLRRAYSSHKIRPLCTHTRHVHLICPCSKCGQVIAFTKPNKRPSVPCGDASPTTSICRPILHSQPIRSRLQESGGGFRLAFFFFARTERGVGRQTVCFLSVVSAPRTIHQND